MTETIPHLTTLEVIQAIPAEVVAGAEVTVLVRASCASGCPLTGAQINIIAPDGGIIAQGSISASDVTEDTQLVVTVPNQVGAFVWSAVFPRHETEDGVHQESALVPMPFNTLPHKTSMAVWNVPSVVVANSVVKVNVGMRCSSGCGMAGRVVEVADDRGTKIGEGTLGDSPWTGTEALYWTQLELTVPATAGTMAYLATGGTPELEPLHEASTAGFSVRTTGQPEHVVTVHVVDKTTGAGVSDVEVRLGPYIRSTDQLGYVRVDVPGGTYDLTIRKDGFGAFPMDVEVGADLSVRIDAIAVPTMDELAPTLSSFQGFPWG